MFANTFSGERAFARFSLLFLSALAISVEGLMSGLSGWLTISALILGADIIFGFSIKLFSIVFERIGDWLVPAIYSGLVVVGGILLGYDLYSGHSMEWLGYISGALAFWTGIAWLSLLIRAHDEYYFVGGGIISSISAFSVVQCCGYIFALDSTSLGISLFISFCTLFVCLSFLLAKEVCFVIKEEQLKSKKPKSSPLEV